MARPGVTYQDVSSAASELKGQGKSITIENIRALLGTGSIGTINKYLRQWREAQSSTLKISSQNNIPDELVSVLKGLWDRVVTKSSEEFTPIEEELRNEIASLKEEVEKYKSNNQRWQKLFNQWQQEKAELDKGKLTLEQALNFSQKENAEVAIKHDSLYQQLQEKQVRVDELNRLHKQAQENLEHFRESAREQRLLDQQKFEQEKQQYLLDIKKLNEELALRKDQYLMLQSENQTLQRVKQALETTNQQAQSKLDQLSETLKETEKAKALLEKDITHWQLETADIKAQLKQKMEQVSELQAEYKLLNQRFTEAKAQIENLKDQNKHLANDKWILGQEKAQIEGQLKQMQKTLAIS